MSYQKDTFQLISSIVGQNNIIPIQIEMVRFVGDYHTAALLTQLIYWQGKQKDPDGWIYKTYEEWERETALTKYQANRSSQTLVKMGFLETQVKKINLGNGMFGNTAVHYKINRELFTDSFCNYLKSVRSKETSLPENKELNFQESRNLTSLSIKTETTNKDYDNEPSPSFSEKEFVTKIASLMALVPKQNQKANVKKTVEDGLKLHTEDYVRLAILYTISNSNGDTTQKFKAYLAKCIEKNWHEGWTPENGKVDTEKRTAAFLESRRKMPDDILKADASNGCEASAKVLAERAEMKG